MTVKDIHKRAMLSSLSISSWSARRYDKKVTRDTNQAHNAADDAGRYNKNLLPGDAPEYKALMQHIAKMRETHYENTLPWSDDGWRILTVKNYSKYTDLMRQGKHEFETLLDDFWKAYPSLRTQAANLLNGMYNDEDYPRDIRDRYGWLVDIKPIPAGGDFRVDLPQAEIDALAKNVETRVKDALKEAQADAVKRLFEVVKNIKERLSATRVKKDGSQDAAIFRDSLIENARAVCDVLKSLNLDEDPKLEEFRREAELMAASTEPETLRNDAEARVETANRADEILKAMQSTYKGMF